MTVPSFLSWRGQTHGEERDRLVQCRRCLPFAVPLPLEASSLPSASSSEQREKRRLGRIAIAGSQESFGERKFEQESAQSVNTSWTFG